MKFKFYWSSSNLDKNDHVYRFTEWVIIHIKILRVNLIIFF